MQETLFEIFTSLYFLIPAGILVYLFIGIIFFYYNKNYLKSDLAIIWPIPIAFLLIVIIMLLIMNLAVFPILVVRKIFGRSKEKPKENSNERECLTCQKKFPENHTYCSHCGSKTQKT